MVGLAWLYFGRAASPLICSWLLLGLFLTMILPSRSTGKLMKSYLGMGSADCQRLTFLCNSSLVPRVWVNPESFFFFGNRLTLGEWVGFVHSIWIKPNQNGSNQSQNGSNQSQNGSNQSQNGSNQKPKRIKPKPKRIKPVFGPGREVEDLGREVEDLGREVEDFWREKWRIWREKWRIWREKWRIWREK